jgi:pseudaminic acid cytidylyltransferase
MINYAIEAAIQSELFDRVVVSTDAPEIAQIAMKFGAEVPFIRPKHLADDSTPTVPVIRQALEVLMEKTPNIDFACCIYPCAPFLRTSDLIKSFEMLRLSTVDYCFPIAEYPSVIQRALVRRENSLISPLFPEYELQRTQDISPSYYDAGQFYWGKVDAWLRNDRIHSSSMGLVIPSFRVVDIDTEDDWQRAELMWKCITN